MIGQYAQGNEPSHHMAYLYNYCGAPWKTQQRVRQIMNDFYHDTPDGLIGNEDCGQMSAWYVMSAMGFYEVTPGYPNYTVGYPLFDDVKIHLENQKIFSLITQDNSFWNGYIHSMSMDGKSFDSLFIPHNWLEQGLTVYLSITSKLPSQYFFDGSHFGVIESQDFNQIISTPVIESESNSFINTRQLSMTADGWPYVRIYFTQNGMIPTLHSKKYSKPFTITSTQTVKAISFDELGNQSKVVTASFHKTNKNYKVTYLTPYNSQYSGDGDQTLIDEQSGSENFRDGTWQGWWGTDMQVIVDLGKEKRVKKVGAEFLNDEQSWIFFPKALEVSFSSDGINFHGDATVAAYLNRSVEHDSLQTALIQANVIGNNIKARYVKIIAHNYGKLPSWHASAGSDAWIFCDEIFVE